MEEYWRDMEPESVLYFAKEALQDLGSNASLVVAGETAMTTALLRVLLLGIIKKIRAHGPYQMDIFAFGLLQVAFAFSVPALGRISLPLLHQLYPLPVWMVPLCLATVFNQLFLKQPPPLPPWALLTSSHQLLQLQTLSIHGFTNISFISPDSLGQPLSLLEPSYGPPPLLQTLRTRILPMFRDSITFGLVAWIITSKLLVPAFIQAH
jgi:hypothetical protein